MSESAYAPSNAEERLRQWDPYWAADFEVLGYARTRCPVVHSEAVGGFWMVTRYEDIQAILRNTDVFSSSDGITIPHNPAALMMPPIDLDPPLQREFRHLLNPCLSPARVREHAGAIEELANSLIDAFLGEGGCEFMSAFARPLPALVLAKLILHVDDVPTLLELQQSTEAINQRNNTEEASRAWAFLQQFARDLAAGAGRRPADASVLSALAHGRVEDRPLSFDEQVGVIMILLLGGLETTTSAFGNIVFHVTEDPSLEDRIRRDGWARNDLDEFLRLDAPVQWLGRTVMERCEIQGQTLLPGEKIMVHLSSANRDEDAFEQGDRLHFDRPGNRHLSFGLGAHRCIGSHLARVELEVGLNTLLDRLGSVRLVPGRSVDFTEGLGRSPRQLPISFVARREGPQRR